jgi:phospholipid/cholesterol/gamma-HCH transport system substrate-binding protein
MDKTKRNVAALGLLTIVAVAVFFWGLYYLLGSPLVRGGMDVMVALESGGGMKRGDRVTLQGVEIGSVKEIDLVSKGVVATLRLNGSYPLPADSKATLTGDVFGAHTLELIPGDGNVKLEKGDTIRGMNARQLTDAAVELSAQARDVLNRTNLLLSPEAVANLHATAAVLPSSAEQLRSAFAELRMASAALRRTAEGLEEAKTGQQLNAAIGRVDSTARALASVANSVDRSLGTLDRSLGSLQSVFSKIDRGDGTLGRLVNDTSLYSNLNGAARDIRALATDMKANPKRYLTVDVF